MNRRSVLFSYLSILFFVLATHVGAQAGQSLLKLGDTLPPLAGEGLNGKRVDVVSDSGGKPAVVVYAFSRAGGHDAQLWSDRLMKDDPHLAIYTVIFLESVPGMFRGLAVSGIKSGMPVALLERTIILYRDEDLWKKRLQVGIERNACVMLMNSSSRVEWITTGPFAEARYAELRRSIR